MSNCTKSTITPSTVAEAPSAVKPGATLTLVDGTNMHQASDSKMRAIAPVTSVVNEGEKVTVIGVDTSKPNERGVVSVWANVVRQTR